MAGRTWEERELPILRVVVNSYEHGEPLQEAGNLAHQLGIGPLTAERAVALLVADGYLAQTGDGRHLRPTPRAMRTLSVWPASAFEEAIRVLRDRIVQEGDPHRRRGFEQVHEGLLDLGDGPASDLITDFVRAGLSR